MSKHTEKVERAVGELIEQIGRSEIKLPELQRDFVWKPTQVAKFVDSLYRGYPSGSLLFWETDEQPGVRELATGEQPKTTWRAPLYLIDGQQRLTSLYRVFRDHPEAQIMFNVDLDQFRNQGPASRNDPKWITVAEVLNPGLGLLKLVKRLLDAGCTADEDVIGDRLTRLRNIREHKFHLEILRGFTHKDMAEIFVRVNSGGRHLDNLDLALAMLSADWPGLVRKLQTEADYWRKHNYGDVDVNLLSRALAAVAMGQSLTSWSPTRISEEKLNEAWEAVKRGLRHVVKLLRANLGVVRSDILPSMLTLIPLIVLLGTRPEGPLDKQTAKAIIYWFLVATVRDRYSGSSDTKLGQDIKAARKPKAMEELLKNVGALDNRPQVTVDSLAGRTNGSPYYFLSLLACHANGARDWWYQTDLISGPSSEQTLEHHHVHPIATLDELYDRADIYDLANLVFISGKANRRISYKSPKIYFPEVGDDDLRAHYIPLDESVRDADRYQDFLAERRKLLAEAMTALLDKFRPDWLQAPVGPATTTDGMSMRLVLYASAWDPGRVVFSASLNGLKWTGSSSMEEFEQAVEAAGVAGIPGDVEIAGESVPVEAVEGSVEVAVGPFVLIGTPEEWAQVLERERVAARSLSTYAAPKHVAWKGTERVRFPITSTD